MTTWENIDSKINNKYPNYKETISENGSKVYSGIKDKASELKNIIVSKYKENTSIETQDKASKNYEIVKDETGKARDGIKSEASSIKNILINWYNNYKESGE